MIVLSYFMGRWAKSSQKKLLVDFKIPKKLGKGGGGIPYNSLLQFVQINSVVDKYFSTEPLIIIF